MGSPCETRIYAESEPRARASFDSVFENIQRLEQRYSRYLENNELFAINQIAKQGGSINVDSETAALLDYADSCYLASEGLFDISSGILRKAWNFKSGHLPRADEIRALLDKIGWKKITWKNPRLSFGIKEMELDFGGIVKEYAADQSATLFQKTGIRHGLVNLGGDIRIIGPHPDGSHWHIAIQHPRRPGALAGTIRVEQGGISSSGDYERCIKIGDRYYSHILNPKTGWPVKGLTAVTVVADFCLVAGSASTIAMLKGKKAAKWLRENRFRALWVDSDGRVENSIVANR
ncbi:MAG: FAD:protein FMN transferase [Gammaproteobacteria bacterium]